MLAFLERKRLILTVTVLLAVFLAWAHSVSSGYVASLPLTMVPTAHAAFLFFWIAFTASSFQTLYPSTYSKWAMRNRRYVGLSFALIHFVHAVLVLSNLSFTEASRPIPVVMAGGTAYLFLGLMALTSNNWSIKTLGSKNWKRLHTVGSYYIFIIFIATGFRNPEIFSSIGNSWMPVFMVAAVFLRFTAFLKRRKAN